MNAITDEPRGTIAQAGITRLRDFALIPTPKTYDVWSVGGRVQQERIEQCAELFRSPDPRGTPVVHVFTAAMSGAFLVRRIMLLRAIIEPYAQHERILRLHYRQPKDRLRDGARYQRNTPGFFIFIGREIVPGAADALRLPVLMRRCEMPATQRAEAMIEAQSMLRATLTPWIDLSQDAIDAALDEDAA